MHNKLPSVDILMAVYKPNIKWFVKQLKSIEAQDYQGDMKLIILNDSSKEFDLIPYVNMMSSIPVVILDNEKNNGITVSFEKLTESATAEYIAYSDQDDLWENNKIRVMMDYLIQFPNIYCCHCDSILIDCEESVEKKSLYPAMIKCINLKEEQMQFTLLKNWTLGCAMIVKTSFAKACIPFSRYAYHDQWIAVLIAHMNRILFIEEALVQHRIHQGNNSGIWKGIHDKGSYYEEKLYKFDRFLSDVRNKITINNNLNSIKVWVDARTNYAANPSVKNLGKLMIGIKYRLSITAFELLLPFIPDKIFRYIIYMTKWVISKGIR